VGSNTPPEIRKWEPLHGWDCLGSVRAVTNIGAGFPHTFAVFLLSVMNTEHSMLFKNLGAQLYALWCLSVCAMYFCIIYTQIHKLTTFILNLLLKYFCQLLLMKHVAAKLTVMEGEYKVMSLLQKQLQTKYLASACHCL
jgi:hypothetical protein